jgi:hypothetical protein
MRIGVSLTSNHPDATDPRQGARWMIERQFEVLATFDLFFATDKLSMGLARPVQRLSSLGL